MTEVILRTNNALIHFTNGKVGVTKYLMCNAETKYSSLTLAQCKFVVSRLGDEAVDAIWKVSM